MTIFIILSTMQYEGSEIHSVYDSEEKAIAIINRLPDYSLWGDKMSYKIISKEVK